MRVWRLVPSLLIAFTISSCSSASTDDTAKSEDSSATAPASSPASSSAGTPAAPKADTPAPAPVVKPQPIVIPAGTELVVTTSSSLNSGKNNAGDTFEGNLALPVNVDGKTILHKGAKIEGKVVDAEGSGRVKGRATMKLALSSVEYNGKMVPIETNPFAAEAEATKGRDAAVVGGGAGLGAAIGAIAGGKKGAATGAIIGGAAGTGTVLATKGKEVEFPAESKLTFSLADSVTVRK
jgi:hypothetical protein